MISSTGMLRDIDILNCFGHFSAVVVYFHQLEIHNYMISTFQIAFWEITHLLFRRLLLQIAYRTYVRQTKGFQLGHNTLGGHAEVHREYVDIPMVVDHQQ